MKNWEKHEDLIKGLSGDFGKINGVIFDCKWGCCSRCEFYSNDENVGCNTLRTNWLYEEYEKPKPKLTIREKNLIESIDCDFEIIREKDNSLILVQDISFKDLAVICLKEDMFEFIKPLHKCKGDYLLRLEVNNGND